MTLTNQTERLSRRKRKEGVKGTASNLILNSAYRNFLFAFLIFPRSPSPHLFPFIAGGNGFLMLNSPLHPFYHVLPQQLYAMMCYSLYSPSLASHFSCLISIHSVISCSLLYHTFFLSMSLTFPSRCLPLLNTLPSLICYS